MSIVSARYYRRYGIFDILNICKIVWNICLQQEKKSFDLLWVVWQLTFKHCSLSYLTEYANKSCFLGCLVVTIFSYNSSNSFWWEKTIIFGVGTYVCLCPQKVKKASGYFISLSHFLEYCCTIWSTIHIANQTGANHLSVF